MKQSFLWRCALLFVFRLPFIALADEPPKPAKTPEQLKVDKDYELLKLFADALDQVERNYVKEVDRKELMEGAIKGMLSKLDPHSSYIGPAGLEKFRSSVE